MARTKAEELLILANELDAMGTEVANLDPDDGSTIWEMGDEVMSIGNAIRSLAYDDGTVIPPTWPSERPQ